MPNRMASLQIWKVLYIPEVNKHLYLLIATGQHNCMSTTMKEGTSIYQNGNPFIIRTPKLGRLHTFDMVLVKNQKKVPWVIIAMLSDYTLWHRRMGHTCQHIIKHLKKNTEGGPNQTTKALTGACEGCKKGKSKRLLFPTSWSRAKQPLDLVHSNLVKMPVLSIHRWIQIYHNLLRWSFFILSNLLPKKEEWRIHSI